LAAQSKAEDRPSGFGRPAHSVPVPFFTIPEATLQHEIKKKPFNPAQGRFEGFRKN